MRRLASTAALALALGLLLALPASGTPRIVGGGKADALGWQFAVALEQKRHFVCTGSLIAPDKVLTAAHCVKSGKRRQLSVFTGSPWISKRRRPPRTKVSGVVVDPRYNGRKDLHDFAVLTLATPSPAQPIELATREESKLATQPGQMVRSAGWGTRSAWGVNVALRLKATRERVYPALKCDRVYGKTRGFHDAAQICALGKRVRRNSGFLPFHSTSCEGDSGGPIVADTFAGPRLVGAVSGGVFPCGLFGPSIYARVADRLGFIRRAAGLDLQLWAHAGAAPAGGPRTYARFENGPPKYRPRHLFFGGHVELVSLRWSKWGTKLARGSGTYQVYGCPPNNICGEPASARAVLTGRRPCGDYFVFKRLKVDFEVSGQPRSRTFKAYCAGA